MRNWRTRSLSLPILVVALLALLLLAVLQVIWIGQLSQNAHERMQANANAGAARLSEEFDREIVRAYLDLQMDATTIRQNDWSSYQKRYEAWKLATKYPSLVETIYLAEIGRNGAIALLEYNPEKGTFAQRSWTPEFTGLLTSLNTTYKTRRVEGDLIVGNSPVPIAEDLPALVIPVARPWLMSPQQIESTNLLELNADVIIGGGIFTRTRRPCLNCSSEGPLFAYTVVKLNTRALATEIIPTLAQRHLGAGGLNDYNLMIVSRSSPETVIYQSDSAAPAPLAAADATADMLTLRLDEFNRLLVEIGRDQAQSSHLRIAIGVVGTNSTPVIEGADQSGWQLRLTHKAGSLDAAVASLRLRNLLISFGSILLLGTALAMIVVSTRRAQRIARQKVEFVAAISHELRTPISVICSAGANLADGLVEDPERTRQYGALVIREGRRLAEMVDQTVAFAAAQSDRARMDWRQIDPRDLAQQALAAFRGPIEEAGMAVEYRSEPNLPPVYADVQAMQRAVHNLIGNAVKYAAAGGWLRVTVSCERAERRSEVVISVADRGPGIAPGDLPHIFEPFYRGRDAVDSQIHGSGLGLSLVKLAADAAGGRVEVVSEPGAGAIFTLRLPTAARPMGQRAAEIPIT
jgi:two-component system, OmpR family, sensor histidine kinase SenX3